MKRAHTVFLLAVLILVSSAALLSPPMIAPAHAGIMDYMFNAFRDLTTPVETVTPSEETVTPIPHPDPQVSASAPAPARTFVFDVRDAQTGTVISGATCSYYRYGEEGVAERGSVTLKDPPEFVVPAGTGGIRVWIWASGYASISPDIPFKPDSERIDVPVRLEKGTTADGSVVNEEGQPIEGAHVDLSAVMPPRGGMFLGELVTDAQGRWAVQNVPAESENLMLRVAHPAYVPSCKVDSRAGMLTVPTNRHAEVKLIRGVLVSGRVVDEQGNPVSGACLFLDYHHDNPPYAVRAEGDMDGRFRLEHCPLRQAAVVALAPGFAPNAVSLNIVQDTPEVVVVLPPARPVVFQIVDPQGVPLANARMQVSASRENQELYWGAKNLKTDAQGMLTLADAPRGADYFLDVIDWGSIDHVAVGTSDKPVKVEVPARGCIVLRAADVSTGKPIQDFQVSSNPFGAGVPQSWAVSGKSEDGEYKKEFYGPSGKVRYRIEASGYRQGITRWIETDEGRVQIKLSLRSAPMREGHVFDDSGHPAPMPVVQWIEGPYFHLGDNTPLEGPSPIKGDQRGIFSITSRDWEKGLLLVTTDTDAALISGIDFEAVSRVHLKPWGRVVCEMPSTPNAEVSISGVVTERLKLQLFYRCTLDGEGHGVIGKVLPGAYSISRSDASTTLSYRRLPAGNVTVAAGQTAQISVAPGRKVVLQVAVPEEAQPWLAGPQPSSLSFRLQDSANTWRNESASTWLNADSSGRAEMSELAPGAYVLEAEPFYDRERYKGGPIKRFFTTDKVPFVVQPSKPGDDSPLDLGTLQMHAEGEDAPPEAKAPPPGFIIDRLEGGTLSLQELRGRYVLIDFWAVWCKPCEAQLPHLNQVWQEFGQRNDFVLLGLCLGEDLEIIRKFVAEHGSSWPQGVLPEGFGDPVAKQYGVTSLPHILLIGPDGKVVADNLLDDGIESAVRTALGAAHS